MRILKLLVVPPACRRASLARRLPFPLQESARLQVTADPSLSARTYGEEAAERRVRALEHQVHEMTERYREEVSALHLALKAETDSAARAEQEQAATEARASELVQQLQDAQQRLQRCTCGAAPVAM